MHKSIFIITFIMFLATLTVFLVSSTQEQELITLPVKAHIVIEANGEGSQRTESDVRETIELANRIFSQANVQLQTTEVVKTPLVYNQIPMLTAGGTRILNRLDNYDPSKINLFFTPDLNGINGVAFVEVNSALIADSTSVPSYRTVAHEVGHILGLTHVSPKERLMAQGSNGELLSHSEIDKLRQHAKKIKE